MISGDNERPSRVVWVPSLRNPSHPTPEEIAGGVDLTDAMTTPPDVLPPPAHRHTFKATRWPTGLTEVESVDDSEFPD